MMGADLRKARFPAWKFLTLDPLLLNQLKNLTYLDFSYNKLTRGNNVYLLLSHNNLYGGVPANFARINFGKLDLSWNRLQGDTSLLIGANKTNDHINISRNLFELNLSKFLNVSYNRLCGEIPMGGWIELFAAVD
ncbi:hypothetical protein NL676_016826 [Syzygium grande]|nr:hypothetical protein NL676_016826 [Syzygium grande]